MQCAQTRLPRAAETRRGAEIHWRLYVAASSWKRSIGVPTHMGLILVAQTADKETEDSIEWGSSWSQIRRKTIDSCWSISKCLREWLVVAIKRRRSKDIITWESEAINSETRINYWIRGHKTDGTTKAESEEIYWASTNVIIEWLT